MKELSTDWRQDPPASSGFASRVAATARARLTGPFARRFATLSALTAAGQFAFVAALPVLSRLYTPAEFGTFAIYLSAVNLAGPLLSLKFDSALYATRSREEAAQTLKLALLAVVAITGLVYGALWPFRGAVVGLAGDSGRLIVYLLPLGMLLSGGWSVSSAWAVRSEASGTLGIARFLQPSLMTGLQLAAGLFQPTGAALVASHLISHIAYSSFIALRELRAADLAVMRRTTLAQMSALASRHRNFPLFALPAQLSSLSVSNLPPILLSAFYGAGVAGHYGVAYRLVIAPLTIASLPLGAIFIGSLMRAQTQKERGPLVRRVFLFNLAVVGAPVLALGALAAPLAPLALGANWALTGQVVAALSCLGAAQALAAPFSEATSIFSAQALRLLIDGATAAFVIGSLIFSGVEGVAPLHAIWLMSVGGAAFSITGLALIVGRIERPKS